MSYLMMSEENQNFEPTAFSRIRHRFRRGPSEPDWKRLEAFPVLAVAPKRVEAHGIATERLFSYRLPLRTLDSDETGGTRAWNKQEFI